ncbi:MAG: DUF1854 domain-containing protein [bacterium]
MAGTSDELSGQRRTAAAPDGQAATVTETSGLRYLDPAAVRFQREGARLDVAMAGAAPVTNVSVFRAFPLTAPDRFLSIRNEKNEELGLLAAPAQLDPASRALVEDEIRRRYVLPVVRRVIQIRERFEILECQVETDRGACRFSVRNLRESLLRPQPNRYILTDVDGNRFDIPDLRALPPASRAQLQEHL